MFTQFQSVLIRKPTSQNGLDIVFRQVKNQTKLGFCLICHAEARIINYGALSCYSCKTFFHRHSSCMKVCIDFLQFSISHCSFFR